MKKILVTGGLGFIGSHTVVELTNAGYTPVIIDNLSNSEKSVLDGLQKIIGSKPIFYEHDYQDKTFLRKLFNDQEISGVIHFAALKAVGESLQKPLAYFDNNVAGFVSLLETMEESKIANLIFSSSAAVYGEPDNVPITEDAPTKPAESPYGATKQMDEIIIKDVSAASKTLRAVSLRYFNPIGAHASGNIGELPKGVPSNLIPFVMQTGAGIRDQLIVNGDDYPTADGTCIRDYIHVVDLAKAHVQALNHLENQKPRFYDVYNIGTGHGTSVLEVIKAFNQVTGKKLPYKIGPRRAGDVVTVYASTDKANKILSWKAELSLADALRDAWNWQQKITGVTN